MMNNYLINADTIKVIENVQKIYKNKYSIIKIIIFYDTKTNLEHFQQKLFTHDNI